MTSQSTSLRRVKRQIKTSQNPLFEKWLKEWREEAARDGSEMRFVFSRALRSLQKYPLKLNTGKDCSILQNFGDKLCRMIDDKLEAYKASHLEDQHLDSRKFNRKLEENEDVEHECEIIEENVQKSGCEDKNIKKRRSSLHLPSKMKKSDTGTETNSDSNRNSKYLPAQRSGAYAILVTLYEKMQEENLRGFMNRTEIQNYAQVYCDSSFTKPLPGSHSAWSSMGVLIRKKLVVKEGNPAKFSLTEEGVDVAIKLKQITARATWSPSLKSPAKDNRTVRVEEGLQWEEESDRMKVSVTDQVEDILSQQKEFECNSENETIFMQPDTFQIILLVDTQERDDKFQEGANMTVKKLTSKVNFEMRHLKVGDFLWVARDNDGHELVLPYIVERKRLDDLASSIKDGRFYEQKFRLKQSGIENLIYLVEKYGNENQRLGLPLPSLLQAISNTQVTGGFTVKVTNNHDHSMRYLGCLTTRLTQLFQVKTLMSCKKANLSPVNFSDDLVPLLTFKEFNRGSEKNKKPTIRNMFVKHLLQLNGVSIEKAKAIVQLYPTPKVLMKELKRPSGEKSIADLTFGGCKRAIGPVTARQINLLYTSLSLG